MPPVSSQQLRWVSPADEHTDAEMATEGLHRVRSLYQMRRPLPLENSVVAATRSVTLRAFRAGEDDDGFLGVNNRAFSWHPEQGGWTKEQLRERMAESWFDPDGFLIHESLNIDESLSVIDGFCWTKVHPPSATDPAMGEIFVIAADPSTHGTGLGRALTVGGLQHLAGRGLSVAMLYVEHDNAAAVGLYRDLGFDVHQTDAAYLPTGAP